MIFPKSLPFALGFGLLVAGLAADANAQAQAQAQGATAQPTELGKFNAWGAYQANANGGKVCYALASPKTRKPGGLDRDPAYFFISNRPKDAVRNEINVIIGFPVRQNSEVQVGVGDEDFRLYTRADGAWVRSADEETSLIKALRSGRELTVKSTSQRGNVTTDTYSLSGISAALDRINRECK